MAFLGPASVPFRLDSVDPVDTVGLRKHASGAVFRTGAGSRHDSYEDIKSIGFGLEDPRRAHQTLPPDGASRYNEVRTMSVRKWRNWQTHQT
jgi:hypothetical protein